MGAPIRVRFAPSPTGNLHIGGMRTALFNWLFAKSSGGEFLLRIEDTDQQRSKAEYTNDILRSLQWLGLESDEEPIFQSARSTRHADVLKTLIEQGQVYPCDCSAETLEQLRQQAQSEKQTFRYPGTCRNKTLHNVGERHVFRMQAPEHGETRFVDEIRGEITIPNSQLDDWIVARADGSPTYNFVVVIDDHDQGISHVIRGEDHINNTPKQVLLYEALGWGVPKFAHVPMILGSDRSKLSKRHGASSTMEYCRQGYLPAAMLNFLARLGWSHGDEEIFTVSQLKQLFSLEHVGKANAIFNVEKLDWISGQHFQLSQPQFLLDYLNEYFSDALSKLGASKEKLLQAIELTRSKAKTALELLDQLSAMFGEDTDVDISQLESEKKEFYQEVVAGVHLALMDVRFESGVIKEAIKAYAATKNLKLGKIGPVIRFAVSGGSLGLFEMLEVMGKERVLRRLESATKRLGQ